MNLKTNPVHFELASSDGNEYFGFEKPCLSIHPSISFPFILSFHPFYCFLFFLSSPLFHFPLKIPFSFFFYPLARNVPLSHSSLYNLPVLMDVPPINGCSIYKGGSTPHPHSGSSNSSSAELYNGFK